MDSLLDAATEVAQLMGNNAMTYFGGRLNYDTKADGSRVTQADKSSEQLARDWAAKNFPNDNVLGEEFGTTDRNGSRTWIFDPIDGTQTFTSGVPFFGSLVAVMEGDEVVAGAAHFPATDELLSAGLGTGALLNGSRCFVSDTSKLSEAAVSATELNMRDERMNRNWNSFSGQARLVRTWGDCYGYLLVASGRIDVMVDPAVNIWDVACFDLILREAGGALMDWNGSSALNGLGAIGCNANINEQVRAELCFQ